MTKSIDNAVQESSKIDIPVLVAGSVVHGCDLRDRVSIRV